MKPPQYSKIIHLFCCTACGKNPSIVDPSAVGRQFFLSVTFDHRVSNNMYAEYCSLYTDFRDLKKEI